MVFSIGFKDTKEEGKFDMEAPLYWLHHSITEDLLFKAVPVTGEVFYDKGAPDANNGHPTQEIKHDDPRLTQVKQSLEQYLGGYIPQPRDMDTMGYMPVLAFESQVEGEVTRRSYQWGQGKKLQESVATIPVSDLVQEMEGKLKYAANTLRDVVNYSMQNQRNIQVN